MSMLAHGGSMRSTAGYRVDIGSGNMPGRMLPVRHISFASQRYARAAWLLARSARRRGIGSTRIYRPDDAVVVGLTARYPEIMHAKRGAGYWLWKPFIIRDALANARDGEIVFYTDAAMVFIADPRPLLALAETHPVVLFEHGPGLQMSSWTKRDCFVALDADSPEFWNITQLVGGFQLYRAGQQSRAFVEEVCAAMTVPDVLTDQANLRGLRNFPDFREHRHDQSILSIIARKNKVPLFPDPSQHGPLSPRPALIVPGDGMERPAAPYGQIFDLHRKKGSAFIRWYFRRLFSNRT